MPLSIPISLYNFIDTDVLKRVHPSAVAVGGLVVATFLGYGLCMGRVYSSRPSDEAEERRKTFRTCEISHRVKIPPSVQHVSGWHSNSRGMIMSHQEFFPTSKPIVGVIALCHDFAVRLCNDGFAVLMMDVEGHGLSDGLHGTIHDFTAVVCDLSDYFLAAMQRNNLLQKPFFLYGVSMGGALVFNLCTVPQCQELQRHITGVILSAPMVKISDELKPPALVVHMLRIAAKWFPFAPYTPIEDILDKCFKIPSQKMRARNHCLQYKLKPRLRTSIVMLNTTEDIAARIHKLTVPVMIAHGGADVVTCPDLSRTLYENCTSQDKLLKIYPGCVHDLLNGEEASQVDVIYNDMVNWMRERL